MRYLSPVSLALLLAGLAALLAVPLLGLDPVWALGGLLLLWAGATKAAVVAIWRRVVHPTAAGEPERPAEGGGSGG